MSALPLVLYCGPDRALRRLRCCAVGTLVLLALLIAWSASPLAALGPALAVPMVAVELRRLDPCGARLSWDGALWSIARGAGDAQGQLRCRAAFSWVLWLELRNIQEGYRSRHLMLTRGAVGQRSWSLLRRRLTLLGSN